MPEHHFVFPFAALTAQPQLTQALLLAAIEPHIGGVLIEGPRGTAKSTAARALAELLAPAPFVTVPLGAALEHVVGTLDLNHALAGHAVRFAPGLLARAHGGMLYVDEINLLPDTLVDVLLDAAASGRNVVERDGISHSHPARFVLIGTMNPEEGPLRPQLLDRLGLCVRLGNVTDAAQRQAIVKARLAFDADPAAFVARHQEAQARLSQRLQAARARVQERGVLPVSDAVHAAVTQACLAAQVDGVRADLVMLRAARALAAWQGAEAIAPHHVTAVAELVLTHRRHPDAPPPTPHTTRGEETQAMPPPPQAAPQTTSEAMSGEAVDEAVDEAVHEAPHTTTATSQPGGGAPPSDPAGAPMGDWGAMPPEPVGIATLAPPPPHSPLAPQSAFKPLKPVSAPVSAAKKT